MEAEESDGSEDRRTTCQNRGIPSLAEAHVEHRAEKYSPE